jgi:putative DNA-invertase from lambdoid prophage Rac
MIFGYCRVSSEGQEDNTSLGDQEQRLRGWAMMKGVKDFGLMVYTEVVSGSIALKDRDRGGELLRNLVKGDTVVAIKIDRMFRSACDALAVAKDFQQRGIDLVFTDLGPDPVTQDGYSRLFFGILAQIAEFEREQIALRFAAGKRVKRQRGGHIGGLAPFGYRVRGDGKDAKLKPDYREQFLVKKAKEFRAEGMSVTGIAKKFNELDFRHRGKSRFQFIQIKRMLDYVPPALVELVESPPEQPVISLETILNG